MRVPGFETLVNVDTICDAFRVDYFGGDLAIQADYVDYAGETHTLCISAFAIRDLMDKLQEGQMAILEKTVKASKGIAFDLVSGPTKGEISYPQEGQ